MDNLMLAWRKIENLFVPGDIWFDPLRLAAFKYRLKDNLKLISRQLKTGSYQMHELSPVPFPKKKGADDNIPPIRQSFIIDVADQLVWVAVCNVIGLKLDMRMPAWSYGNRLYLYWWKDAMDKWQIGNYRNSTPTLYRNWNQSWPQMKRRITVSLKKMACTRELDEDDNKVLKQEQETTLDYVKLKYLTPGYFDQYKGSPTNTLYWMGLDLTKFFPHISIDKVKDIIINELNAAGDKDFVNLLCSLCRFVTDIRDYSGKENDLKLMGFDDLEEASYTKLPTGLLVAGFLANVFMLDIDRRADAYLDNHHDVIHFRYVDDHVIIGRTPEATKQWVETYLSWLQDNGLEINESKTEPKDVLKRVDDNLLVDLQKLESNGAVDSFYPTPLMTQTLQKVSMLSKEKLPLLSGSEFNLVFKDLQSMLVTDIPETEIKKATRISFACTMLSRMMRDGQVDYHEVYMTRRNLYEKFSVKDDTRSQTIQHKLKEWLFRDDFKLSKEEEAQLKPDELQDFNHLRTMIEDGSRKANLLAKNIFGLLMRSLNEVPDKVKIWVRAFLFAVNHYPEGIKYLRNQLQKIEKQYALHHLSVLYLESILEFLSAEAIPDIILRLYRNEYSSSEEQKRDIQSLEFLVKSPYSDEGFRFKRVSSFAVMKSQEIYQKHCTKLGMKPIEGFNAPATVFEYDDGLALDSTFWEIWKLDSIDIEEGNNTSIIKNIVEVSNVNASSDYLEGYLFKVLSLLPTINSSASLFLPKFECEQYYSPELQYAIRMFDSQGQLFKLEQRACPEHTGWVSLYDWIAKTDAEMNSHNKKENAIFRRELMNNVQYHEIFSVKLMLEIVKVVKDAMGRDTGTWSSRRLHPMNIHIKEDTLKNPKWSLLRDDIRIDVRLYDDDLNGAEVYYEMTSTAPLKLPLNFTVCYSLGLVFLHLLTRKTYFPWIMNAPNYGYEWRRELNAILNRGAVASLDYKIVEACLSLWNRESLLLRTALEPEMVQKDKSQSIEIFSIGDLEEWLERSLQQMRDNLISVPDNQFRQLIEITVN